jgi:phospholipid/cholesterol/gamma-HCH transport system ATP-binding protein
VKLRTERCEPEHSEFFIVISVENLKKTFGQQVVLDGVSLQIPKGVTTAIIGPSGTGKSVLLKIITGLLTADSGSVMVGSESMTGAKSASERRRICEKMGVLFQGAALFDSLNLIDNVCFPLRYRKLLPAKEIIFKAAEMLNHVGLSGYEYALPGEVSIGMRKRVGIARALVSEPEFLFFDEPNTGLDPEVGQEIYDLIARLQKENGFTGIVVSHEIPEVFQICDEVVMLYQGQVQVDGPIEQFYESQNPVVQQFVAGSVEGPIEFH